MPQLPKPFKRPSIDLGKAQRVWDYLPISEVQVGDTVADVGLVTEIEALYQRDPDAYIFDLKNMHGRVTRIQWLRWSQSEPTVLAFAEDRG